MVDIVLPKGEDGNENHSLFMQLMIFVHDFLHDFNVIKFKERLSTIAKYIADIRIEGLDRYTRGGMKRKGDPLERDPQFEYDSESIDPSELKNYSEWGEGETGHFLNNWYLNLDDEMKGSLLRIDFGNIFKGTITRSRAKVIQLIKEYINETQLFVMGKILDPVRRGGSIKGGRHSRTGSHSRGQSTRRKLKQKPNTRRSVRVRRPIGIHSVSPKKKTNEKYKSRSKTQMSIKTEISPHFTYENNWISMLNAINFTANEAGRKNYPGSESEVEVKKYFEFMKLSFMHFKDFNNSPYETFNNHYMECIMVLYLLDPEHSFVNEENLGKILKSLQDHYNKTFDTKKRSKTGTSHHESRSSNHQTGTSHHESRSSKSKGGALTDQTNAAVIKLIEDKFQIFIPILDGRMDINVFYSMEVHIIDIQEQSIVHLIKSIYDTINDVSQVNAVLKIRQFNALYDDFIKKSQEYRASKEPGGRPQRHDPKKNFLSAEIKLLQHIYSCFKEHQKLLEQRILTEIEKGAAGDLTTQQENDVQMISVMVARGGYEYMLGGTDPQNTNEVFQQELAIIKDVLKKRHVSSTIDTNIRNAFIRFATRIPGYLDDKGAQTLVRQSLKSNPKGVVALNNAATKSLKEFLGVPETNHICSSAVVVDAQGSTGTCSGKIPQARKEFHPMHFKITNDDRDIYYEGITKLTTEGRNYKKKIIFGANIRSFFLPDVKLDVEITDKHVLSLSANNTFKSVIRTILTIWARIFENASGNISVDMLWASLISNKVVFSELISCSSIKSIGDLFQEINAIAENGAYSNEIRELASQFLRIGAEGDQPSGVRAAYLILMAISGINPNTMAGYLAPTKSPGILHEGTFFASKKPFFSTGSKSAPANGRGVTVKKGRK